MGLKLYGNSGYDQIDYWIFQQDRIPDANYATTSGQLVETVLDQIRAKYSSWSDAEYDEEQENWIINLPPETAIENAEGFRNLFPTNVYSPFDNFRYSGLRYTVDASKTTLEEDSENSYILKSQSAVVLTFTHIGTKLVDETGGYVRSGRIIYQRHVCSTKTYEVPINDGYEDEDLVELKFIIQWEIPLKLTEPEVDLAAKPATWMSNYLQENGFIDSYTTSIAKTQEVSGLGIDGYWNENLNLVINFYLPKTDVLLGTTIVNYDTAAQKSSEWNAELTTEIIEEET